MSFKLHALLNAVDALEAFISRPSLEFHHGKHHLAYPTNMNNLIVGTEFENADLENIIIKAEGGIFNNGTPLFNRTLKTLQILSILLILAFPICLKAQHVTVSGNKFMVNGKEIFMNGANTPWNNWNDFGGNYKSWWWNAEFQRIRNSGGNSTRIWISCNGEVGLNISSDGTVTGATSAFWSNLDDMFQLAKKNKIYINATLISQDHFKNSHVNYQSWRNMILNDDKVGSFADNYAVPFVNRYKDNPYLWAIDICNEIEFANQEAADGNIAWNRLQYFVARVASAIHNNSDVLVTLGSAAVKWNSPKFDGNYWSDANLQAQYAQKNARLDFYSPHFYGWVVKWFGNFATDKTPADYGINDRPCIVGEGPATGVYNDEASQTLVVPASQMFLGAWNNGWKGLMPWTSNGVDKMGSLNDFRDGLLEFRKAHSELVNPSEITGFNQEIQENDRSSILKKVYPNPTGSRNVNIILSDNQDVTIQLRDNQGRIRFSEIAPATETSINSGLLPRGTYILSVLKGGQYEGYKIVLN